MSGKQSAYLPSHKMRDIIRDNNFLIMAISRFDIAFGFGDSTIEQICLANHVDMDTFLAVCNMLSGKPYRHSSISLRSLMGYLKRAHTSFLDVTLPKIRHHLIEAINYSETNDVAFLLMKFYDDYVLEVKRHMEHENDVVFEYVEGLLNGIVDEKFSISHFSVNHSHMATKLKELKDIFICHYNQKDNARLSATLFDIIICEHDMMSHFEVERNLFVPAVEALEDSLRKRLADSKAEEQSEQEGNASQLDVLGEREKDILRYVAQGKSNKEIADALCLSIHTVTTHRRNICAKLGIHSGAGLAIFAIIHHLVELKDVTPQQ